MSRVLARPLDTRTVALSVAGLLAAGTGLLTFNYLAAVGHHNAPVAERTVLVAAGTIPAHATITATMVKPMARSADAIDPDALVAPSSAIGMTAVNEIPAGSQITGSKLAHVQANGLPGRVQPGMRAVSIALDRVKSVSNLIEAGDRVDVIAVTTPRSDGAPAAATIIRGAKVLSVGQQIDVPTSATATPAPNADSQYTTATLEVTPKQADLLTLADVNATLRLALRSPKENLRSQPAEHISFAPPPRPVIAPAARPVAPAAPAAAKPAAPAPRPTSPVLVIEGDTAFHPAL